MFTSRNNAHGIRDVLIRNSNKIPAARAGELTYEGATDQAGDEDHGKDYSKDA